MSRLFSSATTDNVEWASKQATTAITFSAWIKVSSFGSAYPRVVAIGDLTGQACTTCNFDQANGRMRFQRPGTSTSDSTNYASSILTGEWEHVAWVSTGTASQAVLYLNGTAVTLSNNNSTVDTTLGTLRIGNGQTANDRPFGGQIAYVSIYSRALSSGDITTLQTNAWLEDDPDLLFASNADVDHDYITDTAGTVTGTTLFAADNPSVTVPDVGGGGLEVSPSGITTSAVLGSATVAILDLPTPTNLVATVVSSSQINITWEDNATDETAYILERSLDGSTGWTVIAAELPANTESYSDTDLAADTTYYYRCRAAKVVS